MFEKLSAAQTGTPVTLTFEGQEIVAQAGLSVAAALVLAGVSWTRTTPVGGGRRAPYCMMGACFDCLMVIDGVSDRQACMVTVADGMTVGRQLGGREIA